MSWVETQVSVSKASGLPHKATCLTLSMEMDAGGQRKKKMVAGLVLAPHPPTPGPHMWHN